MAESANKQLLSALTEGHEKALRSSARNSTTPSSSSSNNNKKNRNNNSQQQQQKVVGSGQPNTHKCKFYFLLKKCC